MGAPHFSASFRSRFLSRHLSRLIADVRRRSPIRTSIFYGERISKFERRFDSFLYYNWVFLATLVDQGFLHLWFWLKNFRTLFLAKGLSENRSVKLESILHSFRKRKTTEPQSKRAQCRTKTVAVAMENKKLHNPLAAPTVFPAHVSHNTHGRNGRLILFSSYNKIQPRTSDYKCSHPNLYRPVAQNRDFFQKIER